MVNIKMYAVYAKLKINNWHLSENNQPLFGNKRPLF